MNPPRRHPAFARILLLCPNEILAFLATAFILQAGLVPFDFQFAGANELLQNSENLISPPSPLHDIIGNFFLFVPFGLFVQACAARHFPSAFSFFLTLLAATLLSGGLESVQAYSPSRVSSIIDVCCNIGGTAIGALISMIARRMIPQLLGAAMFEFRDRPAVAILKAYVLVLTLVGAMPFTFAFDAPRFNQAVGQTVLVPFGDTLARSVANVPTDPRAASLADWGASRRWTRWLAETASFILLTWLLQIVLREQYRFPSRSAAALTWWLAGILAVGLSAGQFLVVTRGLDTTDPLFRLFGVGLGLAAWPWVRDRAAVPSAKWFPCRSMALCTAAWIALTGLAPFQFQAPEGNVLNALSSTAFLPFMAYFQTRNDLMFTDVMEKVASYALLGGLLASGRSSIRRLSTGSKLLRTTAVSLALATAIESAQLFLPVRVVSLTDLLLAATGSTLGVMLHEHVANLTRYILHHQVLGPGAPNIALPPQIALGQVEQLMSTLTDPHPNAPHEPTPSTLDPA